MAIACQGGGSHTAFTAGVLKKLLRTEEMKGYEVVGLSGTSGGAVCALLAWHNLLRGDGSGGGRRRSMPSGGTTPPLRPTSRYSTPGRSRYGRLPQESQFSSVSLLVTLTGVPPLWWIL